MPRQDFRTPRLHVEAPLGSAARISLSRGQANYLANVLRLGAGEPVLVFNATDGEWRAKSVAAKKKLGPAVLGETPAPTPAGDLEYLFAPPKHARPAYTLPTAGGLGGPPR